MDIPGFLPGFFSGFQAHILDDFFLDGGTVGRTLPTQHWLTGLDVWMIWDQKNVLKFCLLNHHKQHISAKAYTSS